MFFKAQRQYVARNVAQESHLRQRFDRYFHGIGIHLRSDAPGLVNVAIEFAGNVEAVKAFISQHFGGDTADGGESRGGVDGDNVIAQAAIQTKVCFFETVARIRNIICKELHDILAQRKRTRTRDVNAVIASAAEDVYVRRADIHAKAVGNRTRFDIRGTQRQVGRIHKREIQRIIAQTKVDIDLKRRRFQSCVNDHTVDVAKQVTHRLLKSLRQFLYARNAGDAFKGRLPAFLHINAEFQIRFLFDPYVHAVVALARINIDRTSDVVHFHINHVVLGRAVIGNAIRALDIDQPTRRKIQACQYDVQTVKIDVDVAFNLRAAFAFGVEGTIFSDSIFRDDVNVNFALLFAVQPQNVRNQAGNNGTAAATAADVQAALIDTVGNDDGRRLDRLRRFRLCIKALDICKRALQSIGDGVVLRIVDVLNICANFFDVGAACGDCICLDCIVLANGLSIAFGENLRALRQRVNILRGSLIGGRKRIHFGNSYDFSLFSFQSLAALFRILALNVSGRYVRRVASLFRRFALVGNQNFFFLICTLAGSVVLRSIAFRAVAGFLFRSLAALFRLLAFSVPRRYVRRIASLFRRFALVRNQDFFFLICTLAGSVALRPIAFRAVAGFLFRGLSALFRILAFPFSERYVRRIASLFRRFAVVGNQNFLNLIITFIAGSVAAIVVTIFNIRDFGLSFGAIIISIVRNQNFDKPVVLIHIRSLI